MLEIKNVNKIYKVNNQDFFALKNINLNFSSIGFISILGPSGCGKTTLLNLIGGLDKPSNGEILINSVSLSKFKSKEYDNYRNKKIGFIFQSYNLINHLTVLENVELSLNLSGIKKKERKNLALDALKKVNLIDVYKKKPSELSGGQCQRVAIARAIVNNPEIILADEPTGALDSQSSEQVLKILKEISKTKLVILVTHNDELANKYSDRIIKIKDGEVVYDEIYHKDNLIEVNKVEETNKKEKSNMNFLSSIKLSFKEIITKKGRTILTSVASSFGIIGVALVLALSNGFTNYINRVEEQTASMLPIQIPSYTVTYTYESTDLVPEEYPSEEVIYPIISGTSVAHYTYNNVTDRFIRYLDYLKNEENLMNDYIINYSSQYSFNLMTEFPNLDGTSYLDIVENGSAGSGLSNIVSQYTGTPSTLFHVLYGEEQYIEETYDLISGTYPKNYNELVLVVDSYNRLSPSVLKALGYYNEETTSEEMYYDPVTFEELFSKKYKVFSNDEMYTKIDSNKDYFNGQTTISTFKENDYSILFSDSSKGIELKIVGVLRPSKDSTFSLMSSGLCYTKELQEKLVDLNKNSQISINYLNNAVFNKVNPDTNTYYTPTDLRNEFIRYITTNIDEEDGSFTYNLNDLNNILNKYITFYLYRYYDEDSFYVTTLSGYLDYAYDLGIDLLSEEMKKHPSMSDLLSLIIETFNNLNNPTTYQEGMNNLITIFAYLNSYSAIDSVIIFPRTLTSKESLKTSLDNWNNIDSSSELHAHDESEQIYYTDIVGDLTNSLGQLINIVSIVLIIFAAISLIVSCVMTGIITYVSVLERTKEIGILRAIGARKLDVGRLFVFESSFIGLLGGIIGCTFTYILSIPINSVLDSMFSSYNIGQIAFLNPIHALILIIISTCLTFISGLIPSFIASKKDPVVSLRSE